MKRQIYLIYLLCIVSIGWTAGGGWDSDVSTTAANISTSTTNFDNNLSSADDTVQKALETLDETAGGGGAGDTFKTWDVPNGTNLVADSTTDTVTFAEGNGITITGTGASDEIDFTFSGALTNLSDVSSSTATAGRLLVADGTDFESLIVGGDITLDGTGGITIQPYSITKLTEVTPITGDSVMIVDATNGALKKADVGDFLGGGAANLTDYDNMIFVGKHGSDSNNGLNPNNAKLTVAAGISVSSSGDVVYVYAGSYNESGLNLKDGTALIGEGVGMTIITDAPSAGSGTDGSGIVEPQGDAYIANISLIDTNAPADAEFTDGIDLSEASSGSIITVEHSYVSGGYDAIFLGSATGNVHLIVRDSTIEAEYDGIAIYGINGCTAKIYDTYFDINGNADDADKPERAIVANTKNNTGTLVDIFCQNCEFDITTDNLTGTPSAVWAGKRISGADAATITILNSYAKVVGIAGTDVAGAVISTGSVLSTIDIYDTPIKVSGGDNNYSFIEDAGTITYSYITTDGVESGTPTNLNSLTGLSDVGSATATVGRILVADGTDFESVVMSGDATIDSTGSFTIQPYAITKLASATPITGDTVMIVDATDGALKEANVSTFIGGAGSGATLYNNIGDPDGDGSIAMGAYTGTYTSSTDGWDGMIFESSVADLTSATTLITIQMNDDGDADGTFLRAVDDADGTPNEVFKVGADGAIESEKSLTFTNATASSQSIVYQDIFSTNDIIHRADSTGIVNYTAATGSGSAVDGMYSFGIDENNSGATANQVIFTVGKGDQSPSSGNWVDVFAVDEDGDILTIDNSAGNIYVADGTDFSSVALSGDVTVDGTGAVTVATTVGDKNLTFTITNPDDLDELNTLHLWTNKSGTDFTIKSIHSRCPTDDYDYVLDETDGVDWSSLTEIDAITVSDNGTNIFYDDTTAGIAHTVINNNNSIVFDPSTDEVNWVSIEIIGGF